MKDADSAVVAVVQKNLHEEVRVALRAFKGVLLVDVRSYFSSADSVSHPTQKGVALKIERLPELIRALQAAEAEAKRLGLLSSRTDRKGAAAHAH